MLKRDEIDLFIPRITHDLSKEDREIFKKYHRTRRMQFIILWLWPLLGLMLLCICAAVCLAH